MKSSDYYRARRSAWFSGKCCANCRSTENLELDHKDPATKAVASQKIWFLPEAERVIELAKCQVLCRKCHREKSGREVSEMFRMGRLTSPFVRDRELARRSGAKGGKAGHQRFLRDREFASTCGKRGGRPRKIATKS